MTDLTGKRILILGAETEIGRAVTTAVAEAGASIAAVAATSDAEAAFAVQRLARRLSSDERKMIAQAIDATNEAAVRVMVRQVSKELGGLDAVVFCSADLDQLAQTLPLVIRIGGKELDRQRSLNGIVVVTRDWPEAPEGKTAAPGLTEYMRDIPESRKWQLTVRRMAEEMLVKPQDMADEVVAQLAHPEPTE